jgi:hypothetical protein
MRATRLPTRLGRREAMHALTALEPRLARPVQQLSGVLGPLLDEAPVDLFSGRSFPHSYTVRTC